MRVPSSESTSAIAQRLNVVASNRGGLALGVWGEAGAGKTFAVQEVLRGLPCRSLTLHATVSGATLLRALQRPPHLPDWASRQVALLERGERLKANVLADVLAAWLAGLAPFVLCLEDLHEVAPEHLESWTALALAAGRTRGVGLIVTSRTPPPKPFAPLHLERSPVPDSPASGAPSPRTEAPGGPLAHADDALFMAAWAETVDGRADEALALSAKLEALAHHLRQVAVTAGASWARGLALERLGRGAEARNAAHSALAAIPVELGPTLERMALELDRLNDHVTGARPPGERSRGDGANGALRVAPRCFPRLRPVLQDRGPGEPGPLRQAAKTVLLEVLGPTQVTAAGVNLSYRTRKGREFLAMLCEARLAGRPEVSDLHMFESLYPYLNEDQAGSALKQLVYRLRNALGGGSILRSNTGYTLGAVETDAERFLRTGDTGLWRGPYLSDLGEDWPSGARDTLHFELRKRALELLPEHPAETARLGCILLEVNPYDFEVLRWTMQAFRDGGNNAEANRLYALAKQHFAELNEPLPEAV